MSHRPLALASLAALLAACGGPDTGATTGTSHPRDGGQLFGPDAGGPGGTDAGTHGLPDAGGSGGADGGGAQGGAPLDGMTFLFRRQTSASPRSHEVVAYDTTTRQERVVTRLESGGSGAEITGLSISHDRKRLALTAWYQPTAQDLATGVVTQILWTLGPDGGGFSRVTPPSANVGLSSTPCTTSASCASGWDCNTTAGRCQQHLYSQRIDDPVWSADDRTLLYDFGSYFWTSQLQGGELPFAVSSAGGVPHSVSVLADCAQVTNLAMDPTGAGFLAIHSVCLNSANEGLFRYPAAGGSPQKLVGNEQSVDVMLSNPSWLADASGFAFVGVTDFSVNGQTVHGAGALYYAVAGGQLYVLAAPDASTSIRSVALEPHGAFAAYCADAGSGPNVYLVDLRGSTPATTQLTNDGASCDPTW